MADKSPYQKRTDDRVEAQIRDIDRQLKLIRDGLMKRILRGGVDPTTLPYEDLKKKQFNPLTPDIIQEVQKWLKKANSPTLRREMSGMMSKYFRSQFQDVVDQVDKAVAGEGFGKILPNVSEEQLVLASAFKASKIVTIPEGYIEDVSARLNTVFLGARTPFDVTDHIMKRYGHSYNGARRIVVTETKRLSNHAARARQEGIAKKGSGKFILIKYWIHSSAGGATTKRTKVVKKTRSGKSSGARGRARYQARPHHKRMHKAYCDENMKFHLRDMQGREYIISGPYDDKLPAKEVVYCHCDTGTALVNAATGQIIGARPKQSWASYGKYMKKHGRKIAEDAEKAEKAEQREAQRTETVKKAPTPRPEVNKGAPPAADPMQTQKDLLRDSYRDQDKAVADLGRAKRDVLEQSAPRGGPGPGSAAAQAKVDRLKADLQAMQAKTAKLEAELTRLRHAKTRAAGDDPDKLETQRDQTAREIVEAMGRRKRAESSMGMALTNSRIRTPNLSAKRAALEGKDLKTFKAEQKAEAARLAKEIAAIDKQVPTLKKSFDAIQAKLFDDPIFVTPKAAAKAEIFRPLVDAQKKVKTLAQKEKDLKKEADATWKEIYRAKTSKEEQVRLRAKYDALRDEMIATRVQARLTKTEVEQLTTIAGLSPEKRTASLQAITEKMKAETLRKKYDQVAAMGEGEAIGKAYKAYMDQARKAAQAIQDRDAILAKPDPKSSPTDIPPAAEMAAKLERLRKFAIGKDSSTADRIDALRKEIKSTTDEIFKTPAGPQREALKERLNQITLERRNLEDAFPPEPHIALFVREALYVRDPLDLSHANVQGGTPGIRDGIAFFEKIVSRGTMGALMTSDVNIKYSANRGMYTHHDRQIKTDGAGTTVHELGHWYDHNAPGLRARMSSFLAERARGSGRSQIYAGKSEYGYKDEFMDHYMGKVYSDGATEIMSMGVQYLFERPLEFAKKDPEMFAFIFNTIRGGT